MNDNLILILSIIVSTAVGAYVGMLISKLKGKSEKGALVEREQQLTTTNASLKETIAALEKERDQFRDEREGLNIELVQKNVEFDTLLKKNEEQKEEVAALQEKFSKEVHKSSVFIGTRYNYGTHMMKKQCEKTWPL